MTNRSSDLPCFVGVIAMHRVSGLMERAELPLADRSDLGSGNRN